MSKVYLFIKQRNVWYETTLPSASPTSCIPTPGTHVVICKETERETAREKGTVVTSEVQKFIAVTEEICSMSALSNLDLIFKEEFHKIWNFSLFPCVMFNHI